MSASEVTQSLRTAIVARQKRRRVIAILLFLLAAVLFLFLLSRAGSFLIVHAPQPSDVIVVLDGMWQKALHLHNQGYAPRILLDAGVDHQFYGRTEVELANEFLRSTNLPEMRVCPITGDSTYEEAVDLRRCLGAIGAKSVLVVAPDFETRRVLATFRKRLPQYRWSIAASSAPYHDADQYWKHRAWAKTVLEAWEHYLWWELVERWRSDAVLQ
ncbi:MAG TPA: ElyC/SanA/YdcF family protein [Bryocella sp.]|nr:ElyC/SanA/YdcF family protein [Bryocella sp.]